MIAFFKSTPCAQAKRIVATAIIGGRQAVISEVWVSFPPAPGDQYGYKANQKFQRLQNANDTGSINDLLREGHPAPGATQVPSSEAYTITGQDNMGVVLDAWWVHGSTRDQDPMLVAAEQALSIWSVPPGSRSPSSSLSNDALATEACTTWQSIERQQISMADAGPVQLKAAEQARTAGSGWARLARAMHALAELPNTSLSRMQLQAARASLPIVKNDCRNLGVKVNY